MRTRVEDIFDKENIEILNTGELTVTAQFPEKEWYFALIFSFGEHVEVLGPERIRRAVASRIKIDVRKISLKKLFKPDILVSHPSAILTVQFFNTVSIGGNIDD